MDTIHNNISQDSLQARTEIRDRIDLLRSRVKLLTGRDRLLMTMYLDNANTFRQMARLAGLNETNIARRIHKIIKRLIDGEYITCLRNQGMFSGTEMAAAKQYFLLGWPIRKIANEQGCSYYRARKNLKKIQRLVQIIKTDEREKGRDEPRS
jgi:alkylated DNA nucleotide flippase Atl1